MTAPAPGAPLPEPFLKRLQSIVPADQLPDVLASFHTERTTSFRVNGLRGSGEMVIEQLRQSGADPVPVDWCDAAWWVPVEQRSLVTHSPLVDTGEIYVQGLSSILASLILDPRPDQQVLDLAAAPGGKATHLAALMNNQGWLSVVEPVRKRMYLLAESLKRCGVSIAHTYLMDGRRAGEKVPGRFDRVLLDAPCSGEARFQAANPESWKFWSPRKIKEQARKQRGLIESGFTALRKGGQMLYATCSFAPEENEAIVHSLLQRFPNEAHLLPVELPMENWQPGLTAFGDDRWDGQLKHARRILPDSHYDGFFLALIGKAGNSDSTGEENRPVDRS